MKNTNDPMMELLRSIFGGDEESSHETKEKPEEIPTETKGFQSLVSKEEYEAIKNLKVAFDNFVEVHNKEVLKMAKLLDKSAYARVQYLLLNDCVDDTMKGIGRMYTIHTCDKEFIDELVEEGGMSSVEDLEKKLTVMQLMQKLRS